MPSLSQFTTAFAFYLQSELPKDVAEDTLPEYLVPLVYWTELPFPPTRLGVDFGFALPPDTAFRCRGELPTHVVWDAAGSYFYCPLKPVVSPDAETARRFAVEHLRAGWRPALEFCESAPKADKKAVEALLADLEGGDEVIEHGHEWVRVDADLATLIRHPASFLKHSKFVTPGK